MIRVENLVKKFGDFTAVKDISFEVKQGEIFAFLGPNGAGKTTTIKMLTTLLRPTSGILELDGMDPAAKPKEVRKQFGIVFQDPSLDAEQTAWENMDLHGILYHVPRKIRLERTEKLLGPQGQLCEDVFGWNEAAPGDCPRLSSHTQDPVLGRANPRPRSAEPQSALDTRQGVE
jgi:ABC-type Na+ transport system ATPase subunit NatA